MKINFAEKIISQTLKKFDLVSREEFEVQLKILHRCREKIAFLEQQLEKKIDKRSDQYE